MANRNHFFHQAPLTQGCNYRATQIPHHMPPNYDYTPTAVMMLLLLEFIDSCFSKMRPLLHLCDGVGAAVGAENHQLCAGIRPY